MALPLFKRSLIRRDKSIPAFHKLREFFWDFVSSHGPRRIAESRRASETFVAIIYFFDDFGRLGRALDTSRAKIRIFWRRPAPGWVANGLVNANAIIIAAGIRRSPPERLALTQK